MPAGADTIREANVRYHDLAAEHYDSKWGINYDEVGQAQVSGKLRKALGTDMLPANGFGRALTKLGGSREGWLHAVRGESGLDDRFIPGAATKVAGNSMAYLIVGP